MLVVGFHKTHTGRPTLTWPESLDEALCFNVRRAAELTSEGRMQPDFAAGQRLALRRRPPKEQS
jgi:hypothetical protein